jgi:hypothetical protein
MMAKSKKIILGSTAACAISGAVALAVVTMPASAANDTLATVPNGTVYESSLPCCQNIVLPAWPAAGPILTTNVIPPGTYSVTGNAFLVMGPGDASDNCWLTTSNSSDKVFGGGSASGNGATESGSGGAGVYANGLLTYTVVVKAANDHLTLNCDSKHFGLGTYAAGAELFATKVPKVIGI